MSKGASFSLVLNNGAIQRMLKSRQGPVGRFIRRVGIEWVDTARKRAPVRTGALRDSIKVIEWNKGLLVLEAGATVDYSLAVHQGRTGIRTVTPSKSSVLKFPDKAGVFIYRPQARQGPVRPNPFLWDSLVSVIAKYR